ncbi:MAG: GIY-YIG nuclease family protein [Thermaurantimonas sp.]
MYFVYILYSPSADIFYVGQTQDLSARLHRHNARLEPATKHHSPWILIWATSKASRSDALKLERKLKNLSRQRKISFMIKYSDQVSSPDELNLLIQLSGC